MPNQMPNSFTRDIDFHYGLLRTVEHPERKAVSSLQQHGIYKLSNT
jgi:hypothetical protein